MTQTNEAEYAAILKKAWIIYYALAVVLVLILVLFVARDAEEQFFYGIMPLAASYVLRPTERYMNQLIFKFTGIAAPASDNKEAPADDSKG